MKLMKFAFTVMAKMSLVDSAFATSAFIGKGSVTKKSLNLNWVIDAAKEQAWIDADIQCGAKAHYDYPVRWEIHIRSREVCPEHFDYCHEVNVTAQSSFMCVK
ncbi:MAG: hypothetical protein AB7O96_12155 [Pseudobdellovibrionaceae bacterium]